MRRGVPRVVDVRREERSRAVGRVCGWCIRVAKESWVEGLDVVRDGGAHIYGCESVPPELYRFWVAVTGPISIGWLVGRQEKVGTI